MHVISWAVPAAAHFMQMVVGGPCRLHIDGHLSSPRPRPAPPRPARPPGCSCRGRSGVTPEAKHRMTVMFEARQTCSRRSGAEQGGGQLSWEGGVGVGSEGV